MMGLPGQAGLLDLDLQRDLLLLVLLGLLPYLEFLQLILDRPFAPVDITKGLALIFALGPRCDRVHALIAPLGAGQSRLKQAVDDAANGKHHQGGDGQAGDFRREKLFKSGHGVLNQLHIQASRQHPVPVPDGLLRRSILRAPRISDDRFRWSGGGR